METFRRSFWATMVVFAVLVGTHEGEFWTFSIDPMFSQAGNPWHVPLQSVASSLNIGWLTSPVRRLRHT